MSPPPGASRGEEPAAGSGGVARAAKPALTTTGAGGGIGVAGWTRRGAIGAMAAAGLGFALFGPRGRAGATSSGGRGVIEIDYWEKWTQHEGEAMQRIVDAFNASQSRIRVRYVVTNSIGQKARIAIAGGQPPDVIGLYSFDVPSFSEAGALLPLDALAPAAGVRLEQYKPGLAPLMTYAVAGRAERWWGVVNTAGTVAMYYRPDVFESVGLDPARPPRTIAELEAASQRLLLPADPGSKEALQRVGFLHCEPGWWNWLWPASFGGAVFEPGVAGQTAGRATIDSAASVEAYRWLQRTPRALTPQRVTALFERFRDSIFSERNGLLSGQVAMAVQGPWMANIINRFAPATRYAVCPVPTADGQGAGLSGPGVANADPAGLIDTDVLVIPRGARHPEAAMEFIAFTQRREMVWQLARAHTKINPLREGDEEFVADHPNKGIGVHNAIAASSRAFVAPATRAWPQYRDAIDTGVQRLWRLEATPEEELPVLARRGQAAIDRAFNDHRRRRGLSLGGVGLMDGAWARGGGL